MPLMISELYDALIEGGTSDEKARKAAEAVASYENRLAKIEGGLDLLKLVCGMNLALSLAMFGILLRVLFKVGP